MNTYKNIPVSHDKVKNRRKYTGIHYHDEYELYYLVSGETKYFIGNEIFLLKKGNFILVPKGMFHKTDSEECMHNERILIVFNDDIFDEETYPILEELCRCKFISIPESKLHIAEEILFKLEKEYKENREYRDVISTLYIKELLIILYRLRGDCISNFDEKNKIIFEISEYINTNYAENLSLKDLSKMFAISECHLSRKFKKVSGIGINEYITYVRILNAERLLKKTDYSITEIAGMCGFNDGNYFTTVFKRLKGITPYKYSKI